MGWKLDVKSAVVGGLVVAAAAILFGAARSESTPGRFQIAAGQNRAFIVDTLTGQAWDENVKSEEFLGSKTQDAK